MSQNFSLSLTVNNQTHGILFPCNQQVTSEESASVNGELLVVGTSDVTIPVGDVVLPRKVILQNKSEAVLLVGYDGSDYDIQLGQNDIAMLPLRVNDVLETSQVTTVADVSGSLDATFFDMADDEGPVRVWFNVDEYSTPPAAPGGGRLVEVNIATDDLAGDVAFAIATAFAGDSGLSAVSEDNVVVITDLFPGTRTDIVDGTAPTGFAFAVLSQGAAARAVHAKTVSGQATVAVGVIPD